MRVASLAQIRALDILEKISSSQQKNFVKEINLHTRQEDNSITFSIFYKGLPLTEEEYSRIFSEKHDYTTVGHGIKMQLCKKIIDFHSG